MVLCCVWKVIVFGRWTGVVFFSVSLICLWMWKVTCLLLVGWKWFSSRSCVSEVWCVSCIPRLISWCWCCSRMGRMMFIKFLGWRVSVGSEVT